MSWKSRHLMDLPEGTHVFIDANIFIYHFAGASGECTQFLFRCERQRLHGVTSIHILLEVLHRLMIAEAVARKLVSLRNATRKLKESPRIISQLKSYQAKVEAIFEMGIEILPLSGEIIQTSAQYRREYGLLVNDSVTVALALNQGITALASADKDFERVKELAVYSPQDVKIIEGMEGTI